MAGPVNISGSKSQTLSYGFLNSTGGTGSVSGQSNPYSLYASDRIAATEFNAYSDARIKRRIGVSDSSKDLQTLLGIEITDYTMIDTRARGEKPYKKVIAQQVERVFPQAVSRATGVLPDIYQRAEVKNGWALLTTSLKGGESVRLITEQETAVYEVLEVNAQGFRVALPNVTKAFVYGREVKDFRTVDYDALAMLNVSATQELRRLLDETRKQLEDKQKQIDELQAQVKENVDIKKQLAELAALVRKMQEAKNR